MTTLICCTDSNYYLPTTNFNYASMKMRIFFFSLLWFIVTGIKAQDIPSVPADSAYGVVSVSVCNMRAEGKFTSGMTTQALLGMPVKVLQYTGWYDTNA